MPSLTRRFGHAAKFFRLESWFRLLMLCVLVGVVAGVGARAEPPVEPPAAVQDLGRCQLRLHPSRVGAQSCFVKSADGGMATTSRRSSVMSSMAQRSPSRPKPESFTPPYGMWSMR